MAELFDKVCRYDPPQRSFPPSAARAGRGSSCKYGTPGALAEFTTAIKRFADAKGATGLYHETITWAFLLLIAERQARNPAGTWEEFEAANADLLSWKPSILERYYSKELLASDLAKRAFLMPDRL
jgi:hypothetical protein